MTGFLFTVYAWPLEEPVLISQHFGFSFDNPRTDEEIKLVREFIKKAYIDEYRLTNLIKSAPEFARNKDLMSKFNRLPYEDLCDYVSSMSLLDPQNSYAKTFERNSLSDDELIDHVSRFWIIARYTQEEETAKWMELGKLIVDDSKLNYRANLDKIKSTFKSRPSENLKAFSYLLSILISNRWYLGKTFLIEGDGFSPVEAFGGNRNNLSADFSLNSIALVRQMKNEDLKIESNWLCFPFVRERLNQIVALLDMAFEKGSEEKLEYISNTLRTVSYEISDNKIKLLMLSSIIELLVTHNPDHQRYNVEASITKQFKLKAGLITFLVASDKQNKSKELQIIKEDLKTIYDLRSTIAHGDFSKIQTIINKAQKEPQKQNLDYYIQQTYTYLKACIYFDLSEPELIAFIKKG
ncbi:MAG: hypothetical protein ACK481_10285 [Candidatus Melainabacteria bacterium]|jgi:hypothetical protein